MNRFRSLLASLEAIGVTLLLTFAPHLCSWGANYSASPLLPSVKPESFSETEDPPPAAPSDQSLHSPPGNKLTPGTVQEGSPNSDEAAFWHGNKSTMLYRLAPGAEIEELSDDRLQLNRGEVIIEPNRHVTIITPLSVTHILHKSAVLFRAQRGCERIMVLWDSGMDSTVVICQHYKLNLGPGSEAMLADHDPNFGEITEADDIGRRRIKFHRVSLQKHVVTAEFSLLHALQRDPLLYDIAHSNDRHDQSLRQRILKTAAVLNITTGTHGSYTTTAGY